MSGFKRCPFCKLQVAEDREECPKCRHLFVEDVTNLWGANRPHKGAPYGNLRVVNDIVRIILLPVVALFHYLLARTQEAEEIVARRTKW
jgi:hypothetical protein